jgi:hypothetical protein
MRPLNSETSDKSQAFVESMLLLSSRAGIIHNAALEIYRCDNGNAMTQEWIGDFEALCIKHVNKIDDP